MHARFHYMVYILQAAYKIPSARAYMERRINTTLQSTPTVSRIISFSTVSVGKSHVYLQDGEVGSLVVVITSTHRYESHWSEQQGNLQEV